MGRRRLGGGRRDGGLRAPTAGPRQTGRENQALRDQLAQLQTGNDNLSNRLAEAGDFKRCASAQLTELLKLRNDVVSLQRQVGDLGKLREEIQRLQAAPRNSATLAGELEALEQQQQAAI